MKNLAESKTEAELIPSRYVHRLLEVANEQGVEIESFLEELGHDAAWIANKKNAVTHRQYLSAIEHVIERSNDPDIGLTVGQRITPSDHGVLGYAVLASATLRKGLERFSRFQDILGPLIGIELDVRAAEAVISGREVFPLGAKYRFAVSSWAAETNQYKSMFDDSKLNFNVVKLTIPENGQRNKYEQLMGCDVLFSQKVNEIRFPEKMLDSPFNLADSSVAELCVQHCERIVGRMDEKTVLVDKVRRAIMARPGQIPTIDEVAETVNMASRSLRRHLRSVKTSFSEIVSDVRMNLAAEYLLNTKLPPKEIAYLVGYSEVPAFHRAFRRHFERTPNEYRDDPFSKAA